MINQSDEQLFKEHFHLYEMLIKHSFVRNYTKEVYLELLGLYSKYVNEQHNFSHWCSSCRSELVHHLYTWYVANTNKPEIIKEKIVDHIQGSNEEQLNISVYKKRKKK